MVSYVPNSGVNGLYRLKYRTDEWDVDFQKYLKELGKPVILCGDMNVAYEDIDVFDGRRKRNKAAGFTDVERASFGKLLKAGFVDTYRHFHGQKIAYSYWNVRSAARAKGQGWRLDYFVVSE